MLKPDARNHAPTAQDAPAGESIGTEKDNWLRLAQSAFYASTSYVDTNYRKTWEDSIRAFNNEHPSDSKYNQSAYDKRSKVYRPKARTIIRKNEAAAAAAFFSNMDVVSVTPQDQSSKVEAASAAVMKELLQYRLTKSIPWYLIVLGGLQDAQTMGAVAAELKWEYRERKQEVQPEPEVEPAPEDKEYPDQAQLPRGAVMVTEEGQLTEQPMQPPEQAASTPVVNPNVIVDQPRVELIPLENIRIDPAANWMDPVNSSPYVIHIKPMYVQDVKSKIEAGEWLQHDDDAIMAATQYTADSTRAARQKGRDDPTSSDNAPVDDYAIVWVQRHIHRKDDEDWEFYTLSDQSLLSEPRLLSEVVLHGVRPYVIGNCVLETHKIMPTSIPQLGKGLLDEANEVSNQRMDNVKLVLNKKWFVKRGREADVAGLIRNVPGGVVMLDDPEKDVREINWPDVTQSAFQEHVGINAELDELFGNFNPAAIMMNGPGNSPARNMAMLSNASGTLVEYLIRTYVETFVQPVLRQLVQMEQAYETDQVVMKIAAKRAKIFQRYNIDQPTDDLLKAELTLTVNVGMGATDPMQKLQKLLLGVGKYVEMLEHPTPGVDMVEIGKEIFGLLGYSDGSRFFQTDNPQVAVLQQQLQQAMGQIQQLMGKVKEKQTAHVVKLQTAREKNDADLKKAALHEANENKRALATHWTAMHMQGNEHRQRSAADWMPK